MPRRSGGLAAGAAAARPSRNGRATRAPAPRRKRRRDTGCSDLVMNAVLGAQSSRHTPCAVAAVQISPYTVYDSYCVPERTAHGVCLLPSARLIERRLTIAAILERKAAHDAQHQRRETIAVAF